jgi:3-hydroxyisobutyrate dehydrogenase
MMKSQNNNELKIAFLGTGQMGTPMASRLIGAGFDVRVWNRSRERLTGLIALGAISAITPAEAANGADVIITMLPDGATTEEIAGGAGGAVASLTADAIWLQMGTVGMEWTAKLQEKARTAGIHFVDAPVSGSVQPATEGTLIILASGPPQAQLVAQRIFDVVGRHTYWLGAAGAGTKAKLVLNNWLVDLVEMVAENLRFSEALGLDPSAIVDILADAPTGSPYAVAKARHMLDGDFSSSFALKHALKDALLALDAAHQADQELPMSSQLIPTWEGAVADGAGDLDLSVVYRYVGA